MGTPLAQTADFASHSIVEANIRFSLKLFRRVAERTPEQNALLAPTGLSMSFALLENGADPEARKEIEAAFERTGSGLDEINKGFAALKESLSLAAPLPPYRRGSASIYTEKQWRELQAAPLQGLVIADSIWARADIFPKPFLRVGQQYYGTDVGHFSRDSTPAQQISRWASKKTNSSIQISCDRIANQNDFVLVDVTQFREFWRDKFDKASTKTEDFTLLSGRKKPVAMMYRSGRYLSYFETSQFQAIQLPYRGSRWIYVFLPSKQSSLAEFENSLSPDKWQSWHSQFNTHPGKLGLPRIEMETEFDVKAALRELNVNRVFDQYAAFSPLFSGGGLLTTVIQKTKLKIDEDGTEAVSVSIIGGVIGGVPAGMEPSEPFEMIVDRPFFFAIADETTGQLLFLGAVVNP